MSDVERLARMLAQVAQVGRIFHPVIWRRTPEMARVRRQFMRDFDAALAGTAPAPTQEGT